MSEDRPILIPMSLQEMQEAKTVVVYPTTNLQDCPTLVLNPVTPHNTRMGDEDSDDEGFLNIKVPKRKAATQIVIDDIDTDDDDFSKKIVEEKTKGQGPLAVKWCFTINNPKITGDALKEMLEDERKIKLAVFQKETGRNGTPHFQGYLELNTRGHMSAVKKMFENMNPHLENAKGTRVDNFVYCTKEEGKMEGPWYVKCTEEDGKTKSGKQGKRTDLDNFAALVLEEGGVTEKVIEEMGGHALQFCKHAENLVRMNKIKKAKADKAGMWKERYRKVQAGEMTMEEAGMKPIHLELWIGPTAVGKSTGVNMEVFGEMSYDAAYDKDGNHKWWDGYDNEEVVIINEMRGDGMCNMETFNYLADEGSKQVEVKGGAVEMMAKRMYFTTNRHPSHWWKKNADAFFDWDDARYRAVARRFAKVVWWNDAKEKTILENPGPDNGSEEWKLKHEAWVKFWRWRSRPILPTDNLPLMEQNYFTWY